VDFVAELSAMAQSSDTATLGHAVAALKDRLLSEPRIDDVAESPVLEALLGAPLDAPARGDDDLTHRLRRACGLFTATAQFQLVGYPGPDVPKGLTVMAPAGLSFKELCADLGNQLFDTDVVQCGDHALKINLNE
jgi:hypothetical protein